jgi:ribonucleoside-diphosphate reductase alpha chain
MQYLGINIDIKRDQLLTDFSLTLLRDYYMRANETSPQQTFARASVAYCGGDLTLAQRLYDYASKQWFMFASPVLSNAYLEGEEVKTLPISCFAGDTPIITSNGCKNMEDIVPGDLVLTHKGRFRKVINTKVSISNDIYKLVVDQKATPLVVTGNHLLLTNSGWKRVDKLDKTIDFIATSRELSEIKEEVYTIRIDIPESTKYTQFKRSTLSSEIIVDEELSWALGFWFAEGSTSTNGTIRVTHGDPTPCSKWSDIMSRKFGLKPFTNSQRTWYNGDVYSKTLTEWFDKEFGKGCRIKELPEWIINLPKKHLLAFYEGFYLGDGYKTKQHRTFELTNPSLVAGISLILMKLEIRHSLQLRKRSVYKKERRYNGLVVEHTIDKINKRRHSMEFTDGLTYTNIKSIEKLTSEDIKVYDIEVEEDHSFSAAGVIAHNCFLLHIEDSLEGLIDHTSELRWLSVLGGGVGGHLSDIRSVCDKSPGPIPYIKTIDSDMNFFRQGSVRRGAYAAYMDISHPDIIEFLNLRVPTGGDVNRKAFTIHNAININYKFMDAVKKGLTWDLIDPHTKEIREVVSARDLWQRILEVRFRTGEPYLFNVEEANRRLPESLALEGLKINGSNLCVAPETEILTSKGYLSIKDLKDKEVDVWNGEEWSSTIVRKTGVNQELIKIIIDDFTEIECTFYHKFYIQDTYWGLPKEVRASELKPGDKIIKSDFPIVDFKEELNFAYTQGFYSGDGCSIGDKQRVYLYHSKRALKSYMSDIFNNWYTQEIQNREYGDTDKLRDKMFVPLQYSIKSKLEWLGGLLDSDGCLLSNKESQSLQIGSIELSFLRNIQKMLHTLGIYSRISKGSPQGPRELSLIDVSKALVLFEYKESYMLLLGESAIQQLISLGLRTYRLDIKTRTPNRESSHYSKVTDVVITGRRDDTYCFSEPKRHMGVFNGILTGQCNEITLPTSKDRTAVCCLSSLNLEYYDEWKDTSIVDDLVEMLDNVLQVFIDNAPNTISKAKYSAIRERSIGLGTMGYHAFCQRRGIAFESIYSKGLNLKVFKEIKDKAVRASLRLGENRGAYPDFYSDTKGPRNAHLMAIAPNANNSIMLNTSPSIEPYKANAYTHRTRAGSFLVKNKYLEAVLEGLGKNTPDVWTDIITSEGSVQHLEFLDDKTKKIFRTAMEMDQRWIIDLARDRQEFICQGQSVNLFFPAGSERSYVNEVHLRAFSEGGTGVPLKGLYYLRSTAGRTADKVSKTVTQKKLSDGDCLACQG